MDFEQIKEFKKKYKRKIRIEEILFSIASNPEEYVKFAQNAWDKYFELDMRK